MRALALIAFMGLQLSMLTCGIDIHVDHLDGSTSQVAKLLGDKSPPGHGVMDQTCQVHASHVFTDQKLLVLGVSERPPERIYPLETLNLVSIPHLIDHPPKSLNG